MAKIAIQAGWNDVPHLDAEQKAELLKSIPPYQRDARTRGIPKLGAGVIYPIAEEDFVIDPIPLQPQWAHCIGLDVGWNRTAAVWLAHDRDTQKVYVYDEHYRGQAEVAVHAQALKRRGASVPIVVDPASRGRSQADGIAVIEQYEQLGLDIEPAAPKLRESGIMAVLEMLSDGRLKVFKTCTNLIAEMRIYRRDEKGNVVKSADHACDALRYGIMSGLERAKVEPNKAPGTLPWWTVVPDKVWAG